MPIDYLRLKQMGPFDDIEFEFDEHVNVFVGPNNTGKSVALMALGEIAVYPFSMPCKYFRKTPPLYQVRVSMGETKKRLSGSMPIELDSKDGKSHINFLKALAYTTFVPALRQSTDYRAEGPGPRRKKTALNDEHPRKVVSYWGWPKGAKKAQVLTKEELKEVHPDLSKRNDLIDTEASLVRDDAIIQRMIDLDYMAYRRKHKSIRLIIQSIATIASEITEGFEIQFSGIGEDSQGLFPKFKTPDGELPLNCLSQGTQSIIQWLARLLIGFAEYYDFPKKLKYMPGVLIVDEIDAHLHASWQRRIIPCLKKNFPNLQIFFSTHSPLMLAGLSAGQIHLLRRKKEGGISVTQNEKDIVGWSADEILRGFMDVSAPTDLATSMTIRRIQQLRRRKRLLKEEKKELEQLQAQIRKDLLRGPAAAEIDWLKSMLEEEKKAKPRKSR